MDAERLVRPLGRLTPATVTAVLQRLQEMFAERRTPGAMNRVLAEIGESTDDFVRAATRRVLQRSDGRDGKTG